VWGFKLKDLPCDGYGYFLEQHIDFWVKLPLVDTVTGVKIRATGDVKLNGSLYWFFASNLSTRGILVLNISQIKL